MSAEDYALYVVASVAGIYSIIVLLYFSREEREPPWGRPGQPSQLYAEIQQQQQQKRAYYLLLASNDVIIGSA